jgi:hypothetical protein
MTTIRNIRAHIEGNSIVCAQIWSLYRFFKLKRRFTKLRANGDIEILFCEDHISLKFYTHPPERQKQLVRDYEELLGRKRFLDILYIQVHPETVLRAQGKTDPPKHAEQLLLLILCKRDRDNLMGDLEEDFRKVQAKQGIRFARLWYWKQALGSAWPLIRKLGRCATVAIAVKWLGAALVTWLGKWFQ